MSSVSELIYSYQLFHSFTSLTRSSIHISLSVSLPSVPVWRYLSASRGSGVLRTFSSMIQIKHMLLLVIFLYKLRFSYSYRTRSNNCEYPGQKNVLYRRIEQGSMSQLVRVAQNRLRDLNTLLDTWYGHDDLIPGVERSTQYTYEALFGTVYVGNTGAEYFFQNLAMRYRFDYVRRRLDKLQEIIMGDEPLQIYCSDDFITTTFPPQYSDIHYPPGTYWDSRKAVSGGSVPIFLPSYAKCSQDPLAGSRAFMSEIHRSHVSAGTMILCPQNFIEPDTTPDMLRMRRLSELRRVSFYDRDEPFHLERITYRNVIFIFLCLLGQLPMSGNEPMDPFKHPPVAGRDVSGWEAATMTALTHPDKALDNPESYAFLIFALYLDADDWSIGISVPMLPSEHGITHFYYSIDTTLEKLVRDGNGPDEAPPMDWIVD
ncbi:uncharacterized protein BDCG_03628 [Blastomyces dermatitidis ER-3]|uniref:Uncharacterized protein n=1 Tax=Ajellomyces dermatitidis (strain ER-3 / ATCC MYA-2586) TaxID=559297 RepID=A0ABP2EWQ3_AJEDR|nr:uncharacterized protein BDCG_03628 [Blastomyces dermatitidis ER-3]EEQ88508.2 hypothetical protein BDCG_03628 [Blastomyces dermatitidis ER-3]